MQRLQNIENSYKWPFNISVCSYNYHQFPATAWFSMKRTREVLGMGGWSNGRVYVVHDRSPAERVLTTLSSVKLCVFARAQRAQHWTPPRSACADTLQYTALSPRVWSGLLSGRREWQWVLGAVLGRVHSRGWLSKRHKFKKNTCIYIYIYELFKNIENITVFQPIKKYPALPCT